MKIVGLDHIVIRVRDLERMLGFYRDVLGCPIERELPAEIGLVQLRAGRALIDLVPVDGSIGRQGGAAPGTEGHNVDHFCLRIEAFDETELRTELEAQGVSVGDYGVRYGADGNGPSLYVSDPEGNTVELKGPPID